MVESAMSKLVFSTREAARLSNLSQRQIRSYVRRGVVSGGRTLPCPDGRGQGKPLRFNFRELTLLKTVGRLLKAGIHPRRLEQALGMLRHQWPDSQELSEVRIEAEANTIVVSDGDTCWEPHSGQTRLLFSRGPIAVVTQPSTSSFVRLPASSGATQEHETAGPCSARQWFDRGMSFESSDPDEAYACYLRALACDPEHVESMINVGRLCSEGGDGQRAAAYFRQAARVDPSHAVAHFNLAVTMHDRGALDDALICYRTALIYDPHFADAHYNLATLLDDMGDHEGAEEHRSAYQQVVKNRPR